MQSKIGDIDVSYDIVGAQGAPVVMLSHSLATDARMWGGQIDALRDRYRVLTYDTRGHGGSSAPQGPYTLEMLAQDAVGVMDRLGIDNVHWMGISMGGMIGQALALQFPRKVRSLVLCDTMAEFPEAATDMWRERLETARTQGMRALIPSTIERWFSPSFILRRPKIVETIREQIRTTPVPGYVGCSQAIMGLDLLTQLRTVQVPTLIIVGEQDAGTPVSASEAIHEVMPNSELVVLENAQHLSNIEQNEAFNRAALSFLQKQRGC